MQQADLFLLFTIPLNNAGIRYMVSGSVASMAYGEPRLTNDVDIIIALEYSQAHDLEQLFPLDEYYCPPKEVIAVEARRPRRGHFNIIHHATGHKADIYLAGTDSLQHWGLQNSKIIELKPDTSIRIAPAEYVILQKLAYYGEGHSEKHLHDIRGMLDVSGNTLDYTFLNEQIKTLDLAEEWAIVSDGQ
jgi:hypothetical protein